MKNDPIGIEVFGKRLRSKQYTLHQLRKMLEAMPRHQRFEALLPVFNDPSQERYGQYIAGELLLSLRPRCSRSIEDILRAVAPAWNVSVKELPFYLLHVFGRERVVAAVAEVSQKYASGSVEHQRLNTIEWWLTGKVRYLENEGGHSPSNSDLVPKPHRLWQRLFNEYAASSFGKASMSVLITRNSDHCHCMN